MKEDLKSIGKNFERYGSLERLTGKPVFCADLELESPLTLKVLRSIHEHARIAHIDTEKAAGVKGLVKIFTAKDIPGKNITGIINKDHPLLASDKVRCVGDAIALVAAESEEAAESALHAINVTYEDLPIVRDPEEALKEGTPKIHEQ